MSAKDQLKVYDPLYGVFCLPEHIAALVLTPEVRRLGQIRLSNTISPALATFGELRRFSHTLGVLRLCEYNPLKGYSDDEKRALAASVLLHDIGTPPFGHLFEYHLKEHFGWSHEKVIADILWGCHAPENSAHQIHGGRQIVFRKALADNKISIEIVEAIVQNRHPLSSLLFGSIDFDNLDNVARAAWSLGLIGSDTFAAKLAAALQVDRDEGLLLSQATGRDLVEEWARLRRKVYDLLVFDPLTVASQAVLFDAIQIGLEHGILSEIDWTLWDEQLLERLRIFPRTKHAISFEYLGFPPRLVFCIQLAGVISDFGLAGRDACNKVIERILQRELASNLVLGHTVIDDGAFSKELIFTDPASGTRWTTGRRSRSVVMYGFLRSRYSATGLIRSRYSTSKERCMKAIRALIEELGINDEVIIRTLIGSSAEEIYVAKRLSLASQAD